MKWSFSAHASFRRCPRQWFYKQVFASPLAKDPVRREAHRLSKLEGLHAWRGKVVDSVISETIIPSLAWGRPCSLETARRRADQLFEMQRAQRMAGDQGVAFFELEYGLPITEEMLATARMEVHAALENLYEAEPVWALLREGVSLVAQRPLSFIHGSAAVRVVPDLIAFHVQRPPAVLDWKVNRYPLRDYWLQLVAGAIAISRCNPHRDWPSGAAQHSPEDVELLEIQLLAGDVRVHKASEADILDAEDFISLSATAMELACGDGNRKDLRPEDLSVTSEPRTCQTCVFRKLCWESGA